MRCGFAEIVVYFVKNVLLKTNIANLSGKVRYTRICIISSTQPKYVELNSKFTMFEG